MRTVRLDARTHPVAVVAIILAIAFLVPALASGCLAPREYGTAEAASSASPAAGPVRYAPSEISDYRGKALTPRSSLPDNSIAGPQEVDLESYRLEITGLVERPLSLGYGEVLALPVAEKMITLHCVEGWSADMLWTGTLLEDLLDLAGVQPQADTLVFVCIDGYETTMELRYARERDIILAWATNGLPLGPENGAPFQVAAEDKWGYKWVKAIRVYREPSYKGYWERRGYSIRGDVSDRFSEPPESSLGSEFE